MSYIEKAVIVVFIARDTVGREIAVINPHIGGVLQLDQVLRRWRVMHIQIAQNDVRLLLDTESTVGET